MSAVVMVKVDKKKVESETASHPAQPGWPAKGQKKTRTDSAENSSEISQCEIQMPESVCLHSASNKQVFIL
jgi:hypothetical protein